MNAHTQITRSDSIGADVPTRYRLRIADYLLLHEHGSFRGLETELVDGRVYLMSPEWRPHLRIKSELAYLLRRAVEEAGLPYFVGTEGSVALSDTDMPRPDVLLTSEIAGDGAVPRDTVPLLVEVSSTTLDEDVGEKAVRYAAATIPEYWVADVNGRKFRRMWSPTVDGYADADEVAFGAPLASVTMEGLVIGTTTL